MFPRDVSCFRPCVPGLVLDRSWNLIWFRRLQMDSWVVSFMSFQPRLDGGFKYFLFSPLLGEMIQFEEYTRDLVPKETQDNI